jgi:uncharacterized protein
MADKQRKWTYSDYEYCNSYGRNDGTVRAVELALEDMGVCKGCGACCTNVQVHLTKADNIPAGLAVESEMNMLPSGASAYEPKRLMAQTLELGHLPRCAALTGKVGVNAECTIHGPNKPIACRVTGPFSQICQHGRRINHLSPIQYLAKAELKKRGQFKAVVEAAPGIFGGRVPKEIQVEEPCQVKRRSTVRCSKSKSSRKSRTKATT